MASRKLVFSVIGVCLGAAALPSAGNANSLGTDTGLPFFGRPYPYGYVYRPIPIECIEVHPVDTPDGPRLAVTWICGGPAERPGTAHVVKF
jgi:hypothetical protein